MSRVVGEVGGCEKAMGYWDSSEGPEAAGRRRGPEDTARRRETRHFGGREEEESAEVRGVPQKKSRREGRRKESEREPISDQVANPKKAGTPGSGARDPCAACPATPGPRWEEPAGRVREQVTLFTPFLTHEVPGLVFRLEIKIIARVMNLMR